MAAKICCCALEKSLFKTPSACTILIVASKYLQLVPFKNVCTLSWSWKQLNLFESSMASLSWTLWHSVRSSTYWRHPVYYFLPLYLRESNDLLLVWFLESWASGPSTPSFMAVTRSNSVFGGMRFFHVIDGVVVKIGLCCPIGCLVGL